MKKREKSKSDKDNCNLIKEPSSASIKSGKIKKKKISLGKIVSKTFEILKKPFSNQNQDVKTPQECKDVELIISKKLTKGEKAKDKKAKAKTKNGRKKETISIDYSNASINKLEKTKEKSIAKQKTRLKKKRLEKTSQETREDRNDFQDDDQFEDANERRQQAASQISTEVNGFFYTNDKFITRFEDHDILKYLKSYYPLFMKDPLDFQTQKKQILDMLQNVQFMEKILKYYDMNIYEFFKFLFRLEPDLFKGSFLKRIQKAMKYKKYAIKAKKCSFAGRRQARLKDFKHGAKRPKQDLSNGLSSQGCFTWHWRRGNSQQ